jgi:hypothetical protein
MKTYYSLSDGVAKNLSFLGFSGIIGLVKNTKIANPFFLLGFFSN